MKTETKFFEIRDAATFIPAMATIVHPEPILNEHLFSPKERNPDAWLVGRAGWGDPFIVLTHLQTKESRCAPYDWPGGARTMREAHCFLQANWEQIESGKVIDVEFLNNERDDVKVSERFV